MKAASLEQVRSSIDVIDRKIVALVTERETWVREAARFKTTRSEVEAPARVEQVIAKVREFADEAGGSPEVVERLYRAMIAAFIELEDTERNRGAQLPCPRNEAFSETIQGIPYYCCSFPHATLETRRGDVRVLAYASQSS